MRPFLLLALLGCASGGGTGSPAVTNAAPDRVLMVDERGRVLRTTNQTASAAEQEVPATTQQALQALVGAYESMGVTVNQIDWNTGLMGARNFSAPRRIAGKQLATYIDCGTTSVGQPRANSYAVMLTVESVVRPGSTGSVMLTTLATGTARQQGVSGDPVHCVTTGALEKRINLLATERLAAM